MCTMVGMVGGRYTLVYPPPGYVGRYTTLVYHTLYYPGYTSVTPLVSIRTAVHAVTVSVPRDDALGSRRRLITKMRRRKGLLSPKV